MPCIYGLQGCELPPCMLWQLWPWEVALHLIFVHAVHPSCPLPGAAPLGSLVSSEGADFRGRAAARGENSSHSLIMQIASKKKKKCVSGKTRENPGQMHTYSWEAYLLPKEQVKFSIQCWVRSMWEQPHSCWTGSAATGGP